MEKIEDEIDKVDDELFDKEINQVEKIEPVTKALSSMGRIWKEITTKLNDDNICFLCKKKMDGTEHFGIIKVPDKKVEKGLIAYAAVCKKCQDEGEEK